MSNLGQIESQRLDVAVARAGLGPSALRLLFKYYPFLLGTYRIVNDRRVRWLFKNEGEHLVALPCGRKIWVDLQDNDGRAIFCGGNDPKVRRIFQAVLRPGDIVVDVGANHGEYTLLAAGLIGGGGRVYAFEPNQVPASRLGRSLESNGLDNVTLFVNAVSDAKGFGNLRCFSGWSGGTQVKVSTDEGRNGDVEIVTLDDVVGLREERAIRLLKIDVEGMEGAVLRGAAGLLAEAPPDIILFESNPCEIPFFDRQAPKALEETGSYSIFEVCRSFVKLHLLPLQHGGRQLPEGRDFVAFNRLHLAELAKVLPLAGIG
jgi:FkbM family methyltransferase